HRVLNGKAAGNLTRTTGDRFADDRSAQHLAVEHDSERAIDVLCGDIRELARSETIEAEGHDRLIGTLVESCTRIGETLAGKRDLIFDRVFDIRVLGIR